MRTRGTQPVWLGHKSMPKNMAAFRRKYSRMVKAHEWQPVSELTKVKQVISIVKGLIGENAFRNGGEGAQLVFPMTSAFGHGEFVRGVLDVLAPKARAVFLVTPWAPYFSAVHKKDKKLLVKEALKNLDMRVRDAVAPNMQTVIVDNHDSHNTYRAISASIKKLSKGGTIRAESTIPLGDFILDYHYPETKEYRTRLRLGWKKDDLGRFAAPPLAYAKAVSKLKTLGGEELNKLKAEDKDTERRRQFLYELGIATARTYLQAQRRKLLK